MSRVELDAIQDKLKTAIQNHQMLVKTKGDKQNVAFKSSLTRLQEEIKRLSEEQKQIVVKLRENLVKSTSQPAPPQTSVISQMLTIDQAATGIGQTRLVSYPTQGGATILPVGMVAVPLAHVQRPALGLFNAGRGQICTPANITLQTGDYASAVAAAAGQLSSGIHANNINIPINNINNNNNIALQNSIAINNITNAINVSTLNGGIVNGSINITGLNNTTPTITNPNTIFGSGVAPQPIGNIVIGSKAITQLNNNVATSVINSQIVNVSQNGTTVIKQLNNVATSSVDKMPCSNVVTVLGTIAEPVTNTKVSISTLATCTTNSYLSTAPTTFIKNQHSLMQQKLQSCTEMVPLPQPSQQRLASNFPIKVPQYTASPIRTNASSTSVQYCSIAPALGPALPTPSTRMSVSSSPLTTSTMPCIIKKNDSITTLLSSLPTNNKPTMEGKAATKMESMQQQQQKQPAVEVQSTFKSLSSEEEQKHQFMKALDLYTPEMLKDLLHKRNERKRRTTANPQYSVGFASNRWHQKELMADVNPFKKAKVGKERKPRNKVNRTDQYDKRDRLSDNHDDFCAACGKGGQLLMCETCRLVYHLDCLRPPLTEAPKYTWSCPKCLVSGKGSANLNSEALSRVHAYIGKRIAKEDDRKKLQKKGAESRNEKSFLDGRSKKLEGIMKEQRETKIKLEEKSIASQQELNQLSELVQSVRDNHSNILPSSLKLGGQPFVPSVAPVTTSSDLTLAASPHVPCTIPVSVTSNYDNGIVVRKEHNFKKIDNPLKDSVIGEDRVLLQINLSPKQVSETESMLLKNGMDSVSSAQMKELKVNSNNQTPVVSVAGNEILSPVVPVPCISTTSTPLSVSAPCDESWKQPVIHSEVHLSASS